MSSIYRSGSVVRRSNNLRAIREHARTNQVTSAACVQTDVSRADQPYTLRVFYANGDTGIALFADPRVAARFLNTCRSWGRGLPVAGERCFVDEYATGRTIC